LYKVHVSPRKQQLVAACIDLYVMLASMLDIENSNDEVNNFDTKKKKKKKI
jgi:hypothetical protein